MLDAPMGTGRWLPLVWGEKGQSTFPHGIMGNIPRSSVVMITKDDNEIIGS